MYFRRKRKNIEKTKGQGKEKKEGKRQVKFCYLSSHFDVPGAATLIV
jgi:hypothetical protein